MTRRVAGNDPDHVAAVAALRAEGATPMQAAARLRRNYSGTSNPNFRAAGHRTCAQCNGAFHHYNKARKYCSAACYNATRLPTPKEPKPPKVAKPKPERTGRVIRSTVECCPQCAGEFRKYPSQTRIYCSYECHIASGGAFRAGMASAKATMRYGAKKDANHYEVVEALQTAGASVLDMSAVGFGFPDLIVGFRGVTLLMEIKNPKTRYGRRGLNPNQVRWQALWLGGPVSLVDGPEAALRALGVLS